MKRSIPVYLVAALLVLLPLAAWTLKRVVTKQAPPSIGFIPKTVWQDIPFTLANFGVGYDHTTLWYFIPALIALTLGLILGIGYTLRRRDNVVDLWWLLLLLTTVVPPFLISMTYPIFVDRYLIACLPAVLLLMLRGWTLLPRRRWTYGLVGIVALTGVIHITHNIDSGAYTLQDWRSAAHYITERHQPGDVFVEDSPLALLCLEYYYPDPADILDHKISMSNESTVDTLPSRLWFVYFNTHLDNPHKKRAATFDPFEAHQTSLHDWLNTHRDQVVDLREFNGVTVFLIDLSQP